MTEPLKPGDLINAVRFSPIETVKDLLSRNADVNEKDSAGNAALFYAAGRKDFIEMARLLLGSGARIDEANQYGNTPLIRAVDCENMEMVRFLIGNNASLGIRNQPGFTARGVAEARGYTEIARMLKDAEETRRKLAANKTRIEESHATAAQTQARLKRFQHNYKIRP